MPKTAPKLPELGIFGLNVRRCRMAAKLTQERLAELVELNPRTIQKIEAGKINVLITTVLRLQRALACPWNDLLPAPPPAARPQCAPAC